MRNGATAQWLNGTTVQGFKDRDEKINLKYKPEFRLILILSAIFLPVNIKAFLCAFEPLRL